MIISSMLSEIYGSNRSFNVYQCVAPRDLLKKINIEILGSKFS